MRKFTTSEEYSAFYGRIEEAFAPEDMNRDDLANWLKNDALADTFALTREVAIDIDNATTIGELKEIRKQARLLIIHRKTLLTRIDEKLNDILIEEKEELISEGITRVEEFAREKRIILSERTIGRQETWKEKKVLTVRDSRGRFVSWKPL